MRQPEGQNIEAIFRALADPTRRVILERLGGGPHSVSRLAEPLGITLTAVVQHLQILEQCGLVRTEKVGRVRTCHIQLSGFEALEKWIQARRDHRPDQKGDSPALHQRADEEDDSPVGIS